MIRNLPWQSVYSPTHKDELEKLVEYCEDSIARHPSNKLVIEIGAFHGATAVLFACYFEKIICIDPFGEHSIKPGDTIATFSHNLGRDEHFPHFMETIERFGLIDVIIPVIATSDCLQRIPNLGADIIFCDDGHTKSCVEKDLKNAKLHSHVFTRVIVHDYNLEVPAYGGVVQAVNEAINNGEYSAADRYGSLICLKPIL